jgi:hypothetical protein
MKSSAIWIFLIQFFTTSFATQLTSEQQTHITFYATAHARLTHTFDPAEVHLEQYFETNKEQIEEYSNILNEIYSKISHNTVFEKISQHDRFEIFYKEVDDIVNKEFKNNKGQGKPWTFTLFKAWWVFAKLKFGKSVPNDHVLRDILCREHTNSNQMPEDKIKEALKKVQTLSAVKNKRDGYLPEDFVKLNQKVDGPHPKKFVTHHIIPAADLKKFFEIYYANRKMLGSELIKKGIYDWYMIEEHNKRKGMIMNYRNVFLQQINPETPTYTKLEIDEEFKKFINRIHMTPLGLSFRGPSTIEREIDPGHDFEKDCEIIIGKEYFQKVKKLYEEIQQFNDRCKPKQRSNKYVAPTSAEIEERGTKIYNRIFSIYLDGGKEFFHYNPNHWIWLDDLKKWKIGLNSSQWVLTKADSAQRAAPGGSVNAEWMLKHLVQVEDARNIYTRVVGGISPGPSYSIINPDAALASLMSGLRIQEETHVAFNEGASNSQKPSGGELRKKRTPSGPGPQGLISNIVNNLADVEEICRKDDITTTTVKPAPSAQATQSVANGFWCSPFYLRLNPMNYIYCKISGHQNLHFF